MKKIVPCGFHCIKLIDLGVSFGEQVVLEDVNVHVHCGSLTAVVGRNGAGKSTLVRAVLGEVPYTGEIQFKDKANTSMSKLKIGYVPQSINIDRSTPMSVYDLFQSFTGSKPILFCSKKEHEHVKKALAEFEVADLIDQPVGTLSGGQLQRVLLAMAVHDTPNLLVLDEPVSGIDKNGMDMFYEKMKYLKETHDLAIIVVSHDLDYVYKYADNVVLIDKTVTAQGTPKHVFNTDAFKDVFGKVSYDSVIHAGAVKAIGADCRIRTEGAMVDEKFSAEITKEKGREVTHYNPLFKGNSEIGENDSSNRNVGLDNSNNVTVCGKEVNHE